MKINLLELHKDGEDFHLTRESGEINDSLTDLIGDFDYEVFANIKPDANGTFLIVGMVKTKLPETCARCGLDFKFKIESHFCEILVPETSLPRNGHYSKVNHFSDLANDTESVVEFKGNQFDLGEYIHEAIAISEPNHPSPPEDAAGNCSECQICLKNSSFNYVEEMCKSDTLSEQLKGIKLN